MNGRSVSVYTDTSASHEYSTQTTSNGHVFILHLKNKCYKLKKLREKFM